MKTKSFFCVALFCSAVFLNSIQVDSLEGNSGISLLPVQLQLDDDIVSDVNNPSEEINHNSKLGGLFGGIFVVFLALILGVMFLVFLMILLVKWKKSGPTFKIIFSGCCLILLFLFILAAIASAFIIYGFISDGKLSQNKNNSSRLSESSAGNESGFANTDDKEIISSGHVIADSEEELAKFAYAKFESAVKNYLEYQKNYDPDIYWKAIKDIECAVEADGTNPAYWLMAGKLYSEIAPDFEVQGVAEEYLRKSLELDPKNVQTMLTLANCLALQERYFEAGELFTKVLSRNYNQYRDYLVPLITYTYIYDRQYSAAEKFLRKLIENDPDAPVLKISLALVLNIQGKGRLEDAKNELKKVSANPAAPQELKIYASNLMKNFDKWHDRRFAE